MKRTESVLVGLVCAVLALLFAYLCVYGSIFTSTIAEKHYTPVRKTRRRPDRYARPYSST